MNETVAKEVPPRGTWVGKPSDLQRTSRGVRGQKPLPRRHQGVPSELPKSINQIVPLLPLQSIYYSMAFHCFQGNNPKFQHGCKAWRVLVSAYLSRWPGCWPRRCHVSPCQPRGSSVVFPLFGMGFNPHPPSQLTPTTLFSPEVK